METLSSCEHPKLQSSNEHTKPTDQLRNFGLGFNDAGQLRQIDPVSGQVTNLKFEFNVHPNDPKANQKRYEDIGDVINACVYQFMESEPYNLKRTPLEKGSFVFTSDDVSSNRDKLMVLIHGSGVVRAGQWARRLIINDSLKDGTQLPYIKRAVELGFSVVVLNTNLNKNDVDGKEIPGSESPIKHATSVWEQIVSKAPAKNIAIVAHSFGGVVAVKLANKFLADFEKRVFAVMFTDSVHDLERDSCDAAKLFERIAINYVASDLPTGTPIPFNDYEDAVREISAGNDVHEKTSASAFDHLFKNIERFLQKRKEKESKSSL